MNRLLTLAFFLSALDSVAQKKDTILLNADKDFAALSYREGVGAAFEAYLADEAVYLSSTPLPIEGKTNFMKLFANTKSTVIWQPTGAFRDKSGTSGYTYGLSKWIYPVADSLACSYYVYNTNWLQNNLQQWKVTTDIGTEVTLKRFSLVAKSAFSDSKTTNPAVTKTLNEKKYKVINFVFESTRKGVVPAILVKPARAEIKAVVCYQHGIGPEYSKEYFVAEAKALAGHGIASLLLDAPFARQGESYMANGGMNDAQILENNCAEWLQAINILPKLNITTNNLFFVGQSYGARVAALMPYLDSRFKNIIIVSGIYNYSEWLQTTVVEQILQLRQAITPQDFQSYVAKVASYDASCYLTKKNDLRFYFQASTKDPTLSEYDVLSCYEMTNSSKRIDWYNSPHTTEAQAIKDRINQLVEWAKAPGSH